MFFIKGDSVPPVLLHYTPEVEFLIGCVDASLHKVSDGQLHAFITSGMEGTHKRESKHYRGEAVDFRVNWPATVRVEFFKELTASLGASGRYILETDHLHVEMA